MYEQYINIGIFLFLLVLGFISGRIVERRHRASLLSRETEMAGLLVFSDRRVPAGCHQLGLVSGEAAISNDYFLQIAASLRQIFGGRVASYEGLLDRARREAVLRMKARAAETGADSVFNVKYATMAIGGTGTRGITCIEVVVYGTAIKRA
ncbi:MAG: YbjQ family protein [Magnetospiraceae bacterium]